MIQSQKNQRAPKGSVSVHAFKGWLRLIWTYGGERQFLYLGLQDNPLNRKLAEAKASQIYGDIRTGNYDPTLKKYKPDYLAQNDASVVDLLTEFRAYKKDLVDPRTLEKYDALINYCKPFFRRQKVSSVSFDKAVRFRSLLEKDLSSRTIREYVVTMNACWEWGIENDLIVDENPWVNVRDSIKVIPKQKPFPLSKDDVHRILEYFESHTRLSHYSDFIWWLVSTGCRTGEAVALNWKHFNDNCSKVWIGESYSRRKVVKAAKMHKARTISLNRSIQKKLLNRKELSSCDLVFPAPKGGYIDDHNFSQRVWNKTLKKLGIKHRKFYMTRSTFISHALMSGMKPIDVANYVGDDVATIYKHYAGYIPGLDVAPELF